MTYEDALEQLLIHDEPVAPTFHTRPTGNETVYVRLIRNCHLSCMLRVSMKYNGHVAGMEINVKQSIKIVNGRTVEPKSKLLLYKPLHRNGANTTC